MKQKLYTIVALYLLLWLPVTLRGEVTDTTTAQSKAYYESARQEIENMLSGKSKLSYERSIYLIENAWWNNTIGYATFHNLINYGVDNINAIKKQTITKGKREEPSSFYEALQQKRREDGGYLEKAKANYAIYKYMADTTFYTDSAKGNTWYHLPYHYSTTDPLGTADWTNTQVGNLLLSGRGNCFAFVSLFKIYSERLQSEASICTAPGHVYISHKDENGTIYNVEVASKAFPGIGTLSTLTHTTKEAIENDISLRELNLKQSVALCLVYLAKGYEHKLNLSSDDGFMISCAEIALQYDSLNLNAMLLKAEILENNILSSGKSVAQLQTDKTFREYNRLITHIFSLGYREMPLDMKNLLIKGWMRDSVTHLAKKSYLPVQKTVNGTTPTRYASLSWGLFDEEIATKRVERYGRTLYNTGQHKITGFANEQVLYNNYNFDPVLFALSVDPLAQKMPGWSPYAAFADNPIMNFDPDGAFPYSIHVRSFAPFETFGGGFDGDGSKRGYTTALGKGEGGTVTSRMQHRFTVDPTAGSFLKGNAWSDESGHSVLGHATAKTHATINGFKATTDKDGNSTATFSTNMASANPLVPGSPDIDIHTKFTLTENQKAGSLMINVVQTGDAFPSAETFIGDTKGNQLFIGVSPAIGSPYTSLPGNGDDKMMSANFSVSLDKDGVFTGVKSGDKTYSVGDWNKLMQAQPTTK